MNLLVSLFSVIILAAVLLLGIGTGLLSKFFKYDLKKHILITALLSIAVLSACGSSSYAIPYSADSIYTSISSDMVDTFASDLCVVGLSDRVAHDTGLCVIVPDAGPHAVLHVHLGGVIVEFEQLCLALAIGAGVDILEQCFVGGDEETVVGVE